MIKCSMSVMKKYLTIASSSSSSSPIPIIFSVPSYSLFSELRFAPAASSSSIPASLKSAMCSSSYKPPSGTRIPVPTRGFHSKAAAGGFSPCGELHVVVGPMFAGKTTTLLRRMQSDMDSGRSVVVIKSNKDSRYGLDSIVSHDGVKLPCWALPNLSSFKKDFGQDAYDKLDVIGIDEAQFFDDLYEFCREAADHDGKKVVVAGLDGDYLRRSFGSVLDIIPLADSVTKLTARCELCGQRAFFTLRKTEERQTELIGGADMYMPVCRRHYVGGQVAVEVARVVTESQVAHCGAPV